jgi:hypothetical protein
VIVLVGASLVVTIAAAAIRLTFRRHKKIGEPS